MSAISPRLATVARDGEAILVLADGVEALRLTTSQATWLIARLAEALAVRS